jgi:hypothetical protein
MTTTEQFQIKPDYYNTLEECNKNKYVKVNNNQRYMSYNQTHFTAGDEEQFECYRNKVSHFSTFKDDDKNEKHANNSLSISEEEKLCIDSILIDWEKYRNLNSISVSNTFKYIFHKFKKGIFIQIRNNKVSVMLPFSKYNYINEWGNLISINKQYGNIIDFFRYIYILGKRKFKPMYINNNIDKWYGNNALIRYEYPEVLNDSGIHMISDMFKELCECRKIPDIEFFVNKRDYPLLTKNYTESYNYIFGDNVPLLSHNYSTYSPILSMCGTDEHADIRIPTWDDWSRVSIKDNKFFPKSSITESDLLALLNDDILWINKINIAIFRGSSTGFGLTFEDNMRLKISKMSNEKIIDSIDGNLFLDAGITKWNVRPRKIKNSQYIDTFGKDVLKLPLMTFMSLYEQSKYKYIINIDGHTSAFRLSRELNTGSVILLVQSKYKLWFSHLLQPYVHYVPVEADLSNIYSQIQWCKKNDEKCKEIVKNSKLFYDTYLSKNGILDYLTATLIKLKNITGNYIYKRSPLDIQFEEEKHILSTNINLPQEIIEEISENVSKIDKNVSKIDKNVSKIESLPYDRTFDLLQGIQWFLKKSMIQNNLSNILLKLPMTNEKVNKKTNIQIYNFRNKLIMSKRNISCSSFKEKTNINEYIHESFIGLFCVNNILKYIPNFSYTFLSDNETTEIYTEYFDCEMFSTYLKDRNFDINIYLQLLVQISLAILVAQQQCMFIHYDLYPWNIMLKFLDNPIDIYYPLQGYNGEYIKITTKIQIIIIDYGKSHGIYNNKHYGFIKPFSTDRIHDILCILLSSMHIIIDNHKLSIQELKCIFQLSRFFSNTKYTSGKTFETTKELKQFLANAKKFAQMLDSPKYELTHKNPLDFIKFICMTFNIKLNIIENSFSFFKGSNTIMRQGTSKHIYEYLKSNNIEEQFDTYINTLNRIHKFYSTILPMNIVSDEDKIENIIYYYEFLRIINSIELLYYKNNFNQKYKQKWDTIFKIVLDVLKSNELLILLYIKENIIENYLCNLDKLWKNIIDTINISEYISYDVETFDDVDKCDKVYNYYCNYDIGNILQDIILVKNYFKDIAYHVENKLYKCSVWNVDNCQLLSIIANKNTFLDLYTKMM